MRVCPERSRSFMRQRIRRVRRVRRVRRRRPEKNARFFPKTGKKNPAENKNLPVSLSGRSRPRRRPRRSGVFWLHRPRLKGLESLTCIIRLIVTATRRAFSGKRRARRRTRTFRRRERSGQNRRRVSVMTNRESRNHRQTSWNVGKNCTNHAGRGGGGSCGTGWSSRRGLREL